MPNTIKNAKIKSTMLGVEDPGIMTFFIMVEWDGAACGLGGYGLDEWGGSSRAPRKGSGYCYQAIRSILETLKLQKWEDLPGTLIRIKDQGPGGKLTEIGHIIEERWFDVDTYMKAQVPKNDPELHELHGVMKPQPR
jgi:hypothetical protein